MHDFSTFGAFIGEPILTEIALVLLSNARAESTRNTYKVGQKHYDTFISNHPGLIKSPFCTKRLSLGGLTLCFFIASLFSDNTKKSQKTIRGYVSHVEVIWAAGGWKLPDFDKLVVGQLLRGVERLRPSKPDARAALLLPHLQFPHHFKFPLSKNQLWLKAATILGFFGMFRFQTYAKLSRKDIVIVGRDGSEKNLVSGSAAEVKQHFGTNRAMGFYLKFDDKFHPNSRAYYCTFKGLAKPWQTLCPVELLTDLASNGLLGEKLFPKEKVTPKSLTLYLQGLTNIRNRYTPHSLRIGGHTFYTVRNMPSDFVSFLGRRKISKASELYYRAQPRDNILRLRSFFSRLDSVIARSI